jgi:hypothetical protein
VLALLILGGSAAALTFTGALEPAAAASIRKTYFSNAGTVGGQTYRSEGELPGEVTSFDKANDKNVFLYVVFGDMSAHRLTGEVKSTTGAVVRKIDREFGSFNRPASWRFVVHRFGIENMDSGEYTLDLKVDGDPAGSHKFTIR